MLAASTVRALSGLLLVSLVSLTSGGLELGGHGCHCDEERGALLHEEHGHSLKERAAGAHAEPEHQHDVCPPFCDDCHGCSSCFHPLAIATPSFALPVVRFALDRPRHVLDLPAQPPRWQPPPPLRVPIAASV